jgi:hypothetical protein
VCHWKFRGHLYVTERNFGALLPLSSDLGQNVEGKVQNTLKIKCDISFFEHFNNFKWKNSELESCRPHIYNFLISDLFSFHVVCYSLAS